MSSEPAVLPAYAIERRLAPWPRIHIAPRRTLGMVALALMAVGSLLWVAIAAAHSTFLVPTAQPRSFPSWMSGPLHRLWGGAPTEQKLLEDLGSWAMIGLYGCYLAVLACAGRLRARWVLATVVVVDVVFFLSPPLSYTDVFNYLNYGRMGVLHGLNPYTTIPALEPHTDATFQLSNWHHLSSPYGPLFTLLTYALVPLGVHASFWVLKLLLLAAALAIAALVHRAAALLGRDPVRAVAFVALNPLVLVWGLGADHNDFFMVALLALAVYLLAFARAGRAAEPAHGRRWSPAGCWRRGAALAHRHPEAVAGAALALAAGLKASAAVIAPILFFAAPRRRALLAGALAGIASVAVASVAAFGPHGPDLGTQGRLVTHLGIPNLIGYALGLGGETTSMKGVVQLVLIAAVAAGAVWTWRRGERWLSAAAAVTVVLIVSLSWAAPWYILWALPLVVLVPSRRLRTAVLLLGAYFVVVFVPLGGSFLATKLHFDPSRTPLGRQHGNDIEQVLH